MSEPAPLANEEAYAPARGGTSTDRPGAPEAPAPRPVPRAPFGATPQSLAREYTGLSTGGLDHLLRLVAGWGILSDLCFGDLLLFVPLKGEDDRFVVLGQVRPSTNRTLHRSDLIGRVIDATSRSLVVRSWQLAQMVDGELNVEDGGERARIQCIPVRFEGSVIAILSRESPLGVGRKWGELERVYVELFERFARMIMEGTFPFAGDEPFTDYAPRVGDGLVALDKWGRVTYVSPNAVNALHRLGVLGNSHGMRVDELVPEAIGVLDAFLALQPVVEEVEKAPGVTIMFRCIPLLEYGSPSGGVLLLRDVTDLRHRDRMLLSKEATIREIHHRVKNNLQTISSLLRLQARRMESSPARSALREAERRIRSIAVVHEILAQEAGDHVPFAEAVTSLVAMAREVFPGPGEVAVEVRGDAGELAADVATPLALAVAELLQNAAEHAFRPESEQERDFIVLTLGNDGATLTVEVRDNGIGLPPGFTIESTRTLGLSIVRDLVTTQLRGEITMVSPVPGESSGTAVVLTVPVDAHGAAADLPG